MLWVRKTQSINPSKAATKPLLTAGEFERSDMVEQIDSAEIEEGELWEEQR